MTILKQVSSALGERSGEANRRVAELCLAQPDLLAEVAVGLTSKNAALAGDCAEVMTMTAGVKPERVAPFAAALLDVLAHKTTRVRWEAMHALAYSAACAPALMAASLPRLAEIFRTDNSIIVRDYAVDAIGNYAGTGQEAAEKAYPLLKEALTLWEGRQAGHALQGLIHVAAAAPRLGAEIREAAIPFLENPKGVVRKTARALIKSIDAG